MNQPRQDKPRRFFRLGRGMLVTILIVVILIGPLIATMSMGVHAPAWMRNSFQDRVNGALGIARVNIGDIQVRLFAQGLNPVIKVKNVRVMDAQGRLKGILPEMDTQLSGLALLQGRIRPVSLDIRAASAQLRRELDGRFDITVGTGPANDDDETEAADTLGPHGSAGDIVAAFETILQTPFLDHLETASVTDLLVGIDDQLSGRVWHFHHGVVSFTNAPHSLSAMMTFQLAGTAGSNAQAVFSFEKVKGSGVADLSTRFSGFRTGDVADQIVPLSWLKVLDAPIAGSVSLVLQPDGTFGDMYGVLDIGAGQLAVGGQAKPVTFTGAKAYLNYSQAQEKLTFNQISIKTSAAQIEAEGHAYLSDKIDRKVNTVIGQIKFNKVLLNPEGVFVDPVRFDGGALDLRISLDPFRLDLGQLVLVDGDTHIVMRGGIEAGETGWKSALDLSFNHVARDRLMALWPLALVPKTRLWMDQNILAGNLSNVTAAMRFTQGQKPRFSAGFSISDASVRFIKTLPPLEDARGYGDITDNALTIVAEQGLVNVPGAGAVNVAGTVFRINDITVKPATATVELNLQSAVTSVLTLLDYAPFQFLSKAGLATDMADGTLSAKGSVSFPLVEKLPLDQITMDINGTAKNVASAALIKNKTVTAKTLDIFVNREGMTISGTAHIGKAPFNGQWIQKFGPEHKGHSHLEGQVDLSQDFLDEFNINLGEGAVSGRGKGLLTVEMEKGQPPAFRLQSDLNRMTLNIDALGWTKPPNKTGRLEVVGRFSQPAEIRSIVIEAAGLKAKGFVNLTKSGKFALARFDEVSLDNWLNTSFEIRPGDNGSLEFSTNGGTLDMRASRFATTQPKGQGNHVSVQLDRLILSSGISLREVSGDLNTSGGLTGSFSGRVNGGPTIVGTLAPQPNGTAVRFTSPDAGEVMRATGLFATAYGGRLDMLLVPTTTSGEYDGQLVIQSTRVKKAPVLADLLSAISVVGLLEQLGGDGLAFNNITGRFRLTPTGVELTEASAVGASLGMTMAGTYSFKTSAMDMRGVITPVYVLNGLLEQTKVFGGLFGKQKGEGLFGFNYTLKGPIKSVTVGVNPLSILTPGMFREIFRQPDPKVVE